MKARLPRKLLVLLLMTGLASADDRARLGTPIDTPPGVALPGAKTPILDATVTGQVVTSQPPVVPSQVPMPVDGPPVLVQFERRPYTPRMWFDAEALLWWMRSANLPPLITASPAGTAQANVGVLGIPGTTVLFGGPVSGDLTAGGRIGAGYWLNNDRTCAVEGYFFQLSSIAAHASAGSPDSVSRPFFNASTGLPDAELVSLPGFVNGTVQASASSNFLGAGVLMRANLFCDCGRRLDALVGYRYLSLSDSVAITENLTAVDPTQTIAPLGTNLIVADRFHTDNYFHGCDIGLAASWRRNAWTLEATARVALGTTYERVDINGATSINVPGFPPVTSPGGFLALSSNSGVHSRNVFAVVPETQIRLAYDINARTRIHLGYNFLYWSRVARAGDQIDLAVNPALLPPPLPGASPLRPAFTFQGTSFWAQGIDLGLCFRF